jgi:LysM repeat protein
MRRLLLLLSLTLILGFGFSLSVTETEAQNQTTYVVQPGDNLYRISLRYNVTIAAIVAANNIPNPNLIYVGQTLVIPTGGTPPPTQAPGTPAPTQQPGGEVEYIVVAGDTLGRIAQRFGTTVQAIAVRNGITNINLIFVGQRLFIPTGGGTVPTPPPSGTNVPQPTVPPGSGLTGFQLGGHVGGFSAPDQMRSAGMTWAKVQIRYNQGDSASIAQGAIDSARGNGFRILLSVAGDKNQLASNPTQYYQDFANFLGSVAALGPDGIEVWNEPNIDREWPTGQVNGANYTQMLSAAYNAIKAANSSVVVISAAPAPTGFFGGTCQSAGCDDNIFIQQMRNAGAANVMDCVGIHYNEGILPPTATSGDPRGNSSHYSRYFPSMVNLYSSTFPSKPLCFTELGYLTPEGYGPLPAGFDWAVNTSVQEHAEWLASAVRLSRQGGRVRLLIVWNVDLTNYGADPQAGYAIIRPDGTCPACATMGAAMQ